MSDSEYEPPPQLFYENSDIQPQQPQQQRPPAVSLSNSSVLFDAGGTGTDTGTVAGGGHLLYHVPQQQIFSNEEQQRLSSSEYEPPTFDELLEGHGGQKGLGQGEGGDAAVGAGGGGQYAVAANFNTNNPNFTASSASTSFSSSAPPSTMIEMNAVHGNAFGGQQPAAVVQRTENHTNVLQHGGVGRDNGQDDVHEEEDDDLDDEELNSLLMQPRTRAAKNSTNTGSGGAAASKSFVPNRIVNSLRNQLFNRNMASRPGGVSSPYNNSAGIPSRFTNPNTPSSSQAQQTLPSDKQSVVRYIVEQRDLDALLVRVYDYYDGKGLLPILLSKITNLLTIVFIVSFSTFLLWCVDHAEIRKKNRLSDVIVSNCAAS